MNEGDRSYLIGLAITLLLIGSMAGFLNWAFNTEPVDELTILWTGALESYCKNSPLAGEKVLEVSQMVLEGTEFTTDRCPLILGTNMLQDWDSQSIAGKQLLLLDGDILQAWGDHAHECFTSQTWHVGTMEFLTDLGC